MNHNSQHSANALIAKVQQLFSRDLALENDYLRQENKILRSKLGIRVPLTEADRRILVKYGLRIKARLAEVMSIAKPQTLLAWNRRQKQKKWTFDSHSAKAGRPRKAGGTAALIVRLAEENDSWGYKRISGELKKLGHQACPSYVRDVLRRHGLPPVPHRKGLSWKQFLEAHLEVIWATDFFTEEVWTRSGVVTFYVLFFIHLGSRRVWLAGCTPQPHAAWMAQQARNFSMVVEDWRLSCRFLVHDRDTSFAALDGVLKTDALQILKTPPHTPLCNAYAERHVREIRETLDNLILLGESLWVAKTPSLDGRVDYYSPAATFLAMFHLVTLILRTLYSGFQSHRHLLLENLALRHQLTLLERSVPKPKFNNSERWFWVALRRCWSDWQRALVIVQPRTVLNWHRLGFRLFWRWKSLLRTGRPCLDP